VCSRPGLLAHQLRQLRQLAGQRGQHAQQGQVVVEVALAAADAVAGQHAQVWPRSSMGSAMKATVSGGSAARGTARNRNCGSWSMSCTMAGWPLASTWPVMPRPARSGRARSRRA
jgi:hypothetical protein